VAWRRPPINFPQKVSIATKLFSLAITQFLSNSELPVYLSSL